MDRVGNRRHGVALPFNYLDSNELDRVLVDCRLGAFKWDPLSRLYPVPGQPRLRTPAQIHRPFAGGRVLGLTGSGSGLRSLFPIQYNFPNEAHSCTASNPWPSAARISRGLESHWS
jgi:hypothetical protein